MTLNWPFLLFALAFGWFYALHFEFARRAWKRIRGRQASEIDQNYVRLENYLGQSFRAKVDEWLAGPPAAESTTYLRTVRRNGEMILVFGAAQSPDHSSSDEVLVVEGDFSCGRDSRFSREILVRGNCEIGRNTRLQAIAANGSLSLGPRTSVARWVDAAGRIEMHFGVSARSRVFSADSILLAPECRASVFCAPRIVSGRDLPPDPVAARPSENLIPIPGSGPQRGFDPDRLIRQGEDCWTYQGDLAPHWPVHITARLIVRGSVTLPSGSWVDGDLKATGDLRTGTLTVAHGNLVAGGNITVEANSVFHSMVWANGSLRLCQGVRGNREGGRVVAYASGRLLVDDNVVIEGKLASGEMVVAGQAWSPEAAAETIPRVGTAVREWLAGEKRLSLVWDALLRVLALDRRFGRAASRDVGVAAGTGLFHKEGV